MPLGVTCKENARSCVSRDLPIHTAHCPSSLLGELTCDLRSHIIVPGDSQQHPFLENCKGPGNKQRQAGWPWVASQSPRH